MSTEEKLEIVKNENMLLLEDNIKLRQKIKELNNEIKLLKERINILRGEQHDTLYTINILGVNWYRRSYRINYNDKEVE